MPWTSKTTGEASKLGLGKQTLGKLQLGVATDSWSKKPAAEA